MGSVYQQRRVDALRRLLIEGKLDAVIITGAENRRYISGFTGSAGWCMIGAEEGLGLDVLYTDFRYIEQAESETDLKVIKADRHIEQTIVEQVKGNGCKVGIEADHMTLSLGNRITDTLGEHCELIHTSELVEQIRMVKDSQEISYIAKAADIASKCIDQVPEMFTPGMTERDLAVKIRVKLLEMGADRESFEPIVASGFRGALPHGRASDKMINPGDLIVIDMGSVVNGYCSDITRTFVYGRPDDKQQQLYDAVYQANQKAIEALKPGISGHDADAVARDYLNDQGWGNYFGHSLGHGVGLVVHEQPRLAQDIDALLSAGMICTVEPGVYIPRWGGIRYEELVEITDQGCNCLTSACSELLSIG